MNTPPIQSGFAFGTADSEGTAPEKSVFPLDSAIARSGSLFVVPDLNMDAGTTLEERAAPLIDSLRHYNDERVLRLVYAVVALCSEDPERCTDMNQLTERMGRTRRTILNILARFEESPVLEKHRIRLADKQRSRDGYVLRAKARDSEQLAADAPERAAEEEYRPQHEASIVLDERCLDYPAPLGDQIAPFQLFAILPTRTGSELTPGRVTRRIQIGRSVKDVEISSEGPVATVLDLRFLLAVTNAFQDALRMTRSGGEVGRHGVFLIEDLLRMMGRPNEGGHKKAFIAGMNRWYNTSFRITGWTEDALAFFGHEFLDLDDKFRMLDNLQILSRPGTSSTSKVPVAVRLSLNEKLYQRMKHPRFSMRVHREILREHNPKAVHHALYFHARRAVKRNQDWTRWPIEHLRREINADKPLRKFRSDVREFLQVHRLNADPEIPIARYNGYIYTGLEDDCLFIRAAADDPILGQRAPDSRTTAEQGEPQPVIPLSEREASQLDEDDPPE